MDRLKRPQIFLGLGRSGSIITASDLSETWSKIRDFETMGRAGVPRLQQNDGFPNSKPSRLHALAISERGDCATGSTTIARARSVLLQEGDHRPQLPLPSKWTITVNVASTASCYTKASGLRSTRVASIRLVFKQTLPAVTIWAEPKACTRRAQRSSKFA